MHFPFVQFPTVITSGLSIGFATVCYFLSSLSLSLPAFRSQSSPPAPFRPPIKALAVKAKRASVHVYGENLARKTPCENL